MAFIPNETLKRVEAGIKHALFIYKVDVANKKFDFVQEQLGAITFSNEVSQEGESIYAGDEVHMTLYGEKTISNTITTFQIDSEFRQLLGENLNADGSYDDGGSQQPFAVVYLQRCDVEDGTFYYKMKTYYSMTASYPSTEDTTRADSVTPNEYEINAVGSNSSFVTSPLNGEAISRTEKYFPSGVTYDALATILRKTFPMPGTDLGNLDNKAPVISEPLVNPVVHVLGKEQSFDSLMRSAGITVIDNFDGDITHLATITDGFEKEYTATDNVPADLMAGTTTEYTITSIDNAGNEATPVTFTVEEVEE